jgi:hypothetical protein
MMTLGGFMLVMFRRDARQEHGGTGNGPLDTGTGKTGTTETGTKVNG